MHGWKKGIQFCNRRPARMKSLVLVVVLFGAASLIASRPSSSEISSPKDRELKEEIKADVIQRSQFDCESGADSLGVTIKTPLAGIALAGSSADSELSYLYCILLRRYGNQSGAHTAHSGAHVYIDLPRR